MRIEFYYHHYYQKLSKQIHTQVDVSIICPIHGDGIFLSKTLNSIRSQTFQGSIEIILILDRCSENVFSIIDSFQESLTITKVISKSPGLVAALNLGLQVASGKYIARIDADDLMAMERVEKQFSFMELNQEVIILGSSVIEIDENDNHIGLRNYPTNAQTMYRSLSKQCTIAHPSVMFRRFDIIKLGSYRPFFEHSEDYDLWLRARDYGKILSLSSPLTFYRIHPGQITNIQLNLRLFGAYSAQINNFLERKHLKNLITRYITFESWSGSKMGRILFQYTAYRLEISRKLHEFETSKSEESLFQRIFFGKILLSIKRLKNWRKL